MNIIQVGLDVRPESGGTYRTIANFEEALRSRGHTTRVLNCMSGRRPAIDGGRLQIRTAATPLLRSYHYCGRESRSLINRALLGSDLVVLHGPYAHPFEIVASYARQTCTPYVVVLHGGLDPHVFSYRRIRKQLWLRLIGQRFLAEASGVICATAAEATKARSIHADVHPTVLHWPVRMRAQGVAGDGAAQTIRARYGLGQDVRLALFVGRIHPVKRVVELAKAFSMSARRLGWVLLIVGPSSPEISVQDIQNVCAKSPGCVYVGPKYGEELVMYYDAAEVLFCLSIKENFGYAVAEACAAGLPVAVSGGVDLAAEISASGSGFVLIDGEDIASFIGAVASVSKDALHKIGTVGRRWSEEALSWEGFVEGTAALVASLVPRRSHGANQL